MESNGYEHQTRAAGLAMVAVGFEPTAFRYDLVPSGLSKMDQLFSCYGKSYRYSYNLSGITLNKYKKNW